ncbi:MAG: hypothetical protein M1838_005759 [Thelocarpon superellum]|nr:MAG: hypothetical protein M1838_005759 [Thelocarpon superellum]
MTSPDGTMRSHRTWSLTDETATVVQEVRDIERERPAESKAAPSSIPTVSEERRVQSLGETAFDINTFVENVGVRSPITSQPSSTVLYLAYGSNLCAETFKGVRGIKPVAQVNVVVPEIQLSFDLPGIPYREPCFANVRYRTRTDHDGAFEPDSDHEKLPLLPYGCRLPYHKNRWKKGLVGVVYEVSLKDYATIIRTEGGGASYQDILVVCHPLSASDTVPLEPTTPPFKAHTLYAPANVGDLSEDAHSRSRICRPDPDYAQPSARYRQLLLDGAGEHHLPADYTSYLRGIRPYTITEARQQRGKWIFTTIWYPILMSVFSLSRLFADKQGRVPPWLAALSGLTFRTLWRSYDDFFKLRFGDGERSVGDDV